MLASAGKVVGRNDVHAHALRHFGGTMATQAGATLAETQARLGHSTVASAMRYQNSVAGRDETVSNALSALALAALEATQA